MLLTQACDAVKTMYHASLNLLRLLSQVGRASEKMMKFGFFFTLLVAASAHLACCDAGEGKGPSAGLKGAQGGPGRARSSNQPSGGIITRSADGFGSSAIGLQSPR